MTSPANGTYVISNVKYPESCMNLHAGLPYSAINSWPNADNNQKWVVENVGPNQITLKNVGAPSPPGYYASVYVYSDGVPAFGPPNPTIWNVEKVADNVYRLKAGSYYLRLPEDGRLVTIFLSPGQGAGIQQGELQWKFQKV